MLKNDTLKNGTSRIGLYGSAPRVTGVLGPKLAQSLYPIKGSIEPTHGSVCSGVRKLQSMNVLKWLSTKAE